MCIDRTFIKAEKTDRGLVLTLIRADDESCGVSAMDDYRECDPEWESDNSMYEFFEGFIANTEWEWILPEDIGALTSAPILGIRDENDEVIEAYGFMDYAVRSLMQDLADGRAFLQKG